MPQVNLNQNISNQYNLTADDIELANKILQSALANPDSILPPSKGGQENSPSAELPTLPKPNSLGAGSSLPLDLLLQAIGEEVKRSETKAGLATVQANAQVRQDANDAKIKKIQEQIDKLEKAGFWDKFAEAFKYIGMALAAVACAAMIATGVGAGVGVAGLTLIGISLANSVLDSVGQAVSGRGWGLTSLIGWGIEAATGSEEAGMWTKMGLDIALSVAAIVCTCGAGSGAAAGNAGKIADVAQKVSKMATIAKAVTDVAGSGATITSAVYTYDAEKARADQKRLQAVLEQIQLVNELVTKHLKKTIEDSQNTTETVSEIVKENAAMQANILTNGGAQAMA